MQSVVIHHTVVVVVVVIIVAVRMHSLKFPIGARLLPESLFSVLASAIVVVVLVIDMCSLHPSPWMNGFKYIGRFEYYFGLERPILKEY